MMKALRMHQEWCYHGWAWLSFHLILSLALACSLASLSFHLVENVIDFSFYSLKASKLPWILFQITLLTSSSLSLAVITLFYFYKWIGYRAIKIIFLILFFLEITYTPLDASSSFRFVLYLWLLVQSQPGKVTTWWSFFVQPKCHALYRLSLGACFLSPLLFFPATIFSTIFSVILWVYISVLAMLNMAEKAFNLKLDQVWLLGGCLWMMHQGSDVSFYHLLLMALSLLMSLNLNIWPARRQQAPRQEVIFYNPQAIDETFIYAILLEDGRTTPFFFSSQPSTSFEQLSPAPKVDHDLSALHVIDETGSRRSGPQALLYILNSLGGMWFVLAKSMNLLPAKVLQVIYRCIAQRKPLVTLIKQSLPLSLHYRFKQ